MDIHPFYFPYKYIIDIARKQSIYCYNWLYIRIINPNKLLVIFLQVRE